MDVWTLDPKEFGEYSDLVLFGDQDQFALADKVNAARFRVREIVGDLKHDESIYGLLGKKKKDRIKKIKKSIKSGAITKKSFEKLGMENVAEIFLEVAQEKKRYDLERIVVEVNSREDALRSIFLPLRRSRVNKYGDSDLMPELNALDDFINYCIDRDELSFYVYVSPAEVLLNYIDKKFQGADVSKDAPIDGVAFEHWCADKIEAQGWHVTVSKASGDQGTDIVAERESVRVAIQCKRYTAPIGNKAVQEAFTGAQNVNAGEACVIGTGGFTPSAKQISAKTGVHLLDAMNIKFFSQTFGFTSIDDDLDDDILNIGNVENDVIEIVFDGHGGGCIGSLLRSLISSSGAEECGIDFDTGEVLLAELDDNTGRGRVAVERSEASMLLALAAHGLKSEVMLTEENIQAMSEVMYYDSHAILAHRGEDILIEDILKSDVVKVAYEYLFDTADSLGPLYKSVLVEKLTEILYSGSELAH